jgi:hypothetical protein
MRKWLIPLLFVANSVFADEILNLSEHPEGDMSIGENLVVAVDETTQEKYLTVYGRSIGKLEIPFTVNPFFEVTLKWKITDYDEWLTIKFVTAEGVVFRLGLKTRFYENGTGEVAFLLESMVAGQVAADTKAIIPLLVGIENVLKISSNDNLIKVFFNERYVEKMAILATDYTQLVLDQIHSSYRFYEFHVSSVQKEEMSCVASFEPTTGELHIPTVSVGSTSYDVYLKQQPDSFLFALDLTRLTEKK